MAVLANNDGVPLSKEWIKTLLDKLDGCDVYDRNLFLSGVIITTPRLGQIVLRDSWEYLKEPGMKWLDIVVEGGETHLPTGPYSTPIISFTPSVVCMMMRKEHFSWG